MQILYRTYELRKLLDIFTIQGNARRRTTQISTKHI